MITPYMVATYLGFTSSSMDDQVRAAVRRLSGAPPEHVETDWHKVQDERMNSLVFDLSLELGDIQLAQHTIQRGDLIIQPTATAQGEDFYIFIDGREDKAQVYADVSGLNVLVQSGKERTIYEPKNDLSIIMQELIVLVKSELDNPVHLIDKVTKQTGNAQADRFLQLDAEIKALKAQQDKIKAELIEQARTNGTDRTDIAGAIQVIKSTRKGVVDYRSMVKDHNLSTDEYTGDSKTVWTIKVLKQ